MNKIDVIGMGMGKKDLTLNHLGLIREASLLAGGDRLLEMFPEFTGQTFSIRNNIKELIELLREKAGLERIVVLASGDPLFYGIGATLSRHLPADHLVIHPNISSIAAAFAAIGLPWHDADIYSLHSNKNKVFNPARISLSSKAAFLTSHNYGPGYIVEKIISFGITGFRACILEQIGAKQEKITWFSDLSKVQSQEYTNPNILILLRDENGPPDIVPHETHLGLPDSFFKHSKGLITKSEVRTLSLSKLRLTETDQLLWDVGSGSGSVGIEAGLILSRGEIYAIEKNPARIPDIEENIKRAGLVNARVVHMNFPDNHDSLPKPDRIFIGGGGEGLSQMINTCCNAIASKGVIVVNTVVMESMTAAVNRLEDNGFSPEVIQAQISRSKPMPYGNRMEALNPVWIISGTNPN